MREIQRRLFQSKKDAEQSIELRDTIKKLLIELVCARKKHQLLHHALISMKLKPTNVGKLLSMREEQETTEHLLSLEEKKKKFEEYKQVLDKQVRRID